MSFPSYATYRESGAEWPALVPSHWTIAPLKRHVRLISERTERRTRAIALEHVESWSGRLLLSATEAEFEGDGVRFESGDVLYGKLRPYLAKVLAADFSGEAVGDFHVLRPADTLHCRFLSYALRTNEAVSALNGSTNGAKMPRVGWDFMGSMAFPIPPRHEQLAIIAFLDRETGKIDALVEEQKRLIELLKEKRQAVISHAVTKGLNPDAPMKGSGIEWLGEVPAHWTVCPLKLLTPPERSIMYGIVLPGPDVDDGIPIIKGGDVKPKRLRPELLCRTTPEIEAPYARARLRANDIVYSIRGSIGEAELVPAELDGANITQDVARISPIADVNNLWLLHAMRSMPVFVQLEQRSLGAAVRGINIFDLKRAQIPLPPRAEQDDIATFLGNEVARINRLLHGAAGAISILLERRSALISAAVTGKIDVRALATADAQVSTAPIREAAEA